MLYFNSAMKGRLYSACLVLLHQHVYLTLKLRCKRCVCKGGHSLSLLPDSWGRPDQIPRKEPFSLNPNHAEGLLPITLRFTWPSAAIPTLAKNIFHTSFITTSSSHICQRKEEKKKERGNNWRIDFITSCLWCNPYTFHFAKQTISPPKMARSEPGWLSPKYHLQTLLAVPQFWRLMAVIC